MIEIMNIRNDEPTKLYDIRVDRSSLLGNPYPLNSEDRRNLVCNQYEKWFINNLSSNNILFVNELVKLHDIYIKYGKLRLFCWCAPKRCHAETIKRYLIKK